MARGAGHRTAPTIQRFKAIGLSPRTLSGLWGKAGRQSRRVQLQTLFFEPPIEGALDVSKSGGPPLTQTATGITADTRHVRAGYIFVAMRGARDDGHRHLQQAVEKGAIALVVEAGSAGSESVLRGFQGLVVEVPSTRRALAELAARFFRHPARELFCVGVTGTNGKTTSTHMLEWVLQQAGLACGVIGTINHHLHDQVWPTNMTTPDPMLFQQRLREFVDAGAKAVALEVSSHALDQHRVHAVDFDAALFTNLTRDHLDYHQTMENYFETKLRLFTELLLDSKKPNKLAVFNADDPWGERAAQELAARCKTSGLRIVRLAERRVLSRPFDCSYEILRQSFAGVEFRLRTEGIELKLTLPLAGRHNVQNALGAWAVGRGAGLSIGACARALSEMPGVRGRLEAVENQAGLHVFVDYAHSDDSLRTVLSLLQSVRAAMPEKARPRIITVFGCGGDRDRGKRPLMLAAAETGSDLVIATSDNPRSEDPEQILDDVFNGADRSKLDVSLFREADRQRAIECAILKLARPGDVILIAGKGHEEYQQIGDVKRPFSDVKVAKSVLAQRQAQARH